MANKVGAFLKSFVPPIFGGALVSKNQTWQDGGFGRISADFVSIGGRTVWTAANQSNTAYFLQNCPALTTIIGRKAQAFVNGRAEVLNFNTDNYVRGKHKAWEKLLRKPNPIQTDRQFRTSIYSYIQAYSFCPVLTIKPVGFENQPDTWQMWILPPPFLKIETNDKYLGITNVMDMVESIELKYDGRTTKINKENVYIFTSMNMNLENLTYPDSTLLPLKYPIENLIKNYEARGTLAEEFGALGILSDNSAQNLSAQPMTEQQKKQIHDDYRAKYGLSKGQRKLLITTASLTYQQMAMPVRDLMLLETQTADVMAIADAFNYPSVLLANEKGTTYSNQEGAKRSFYQDTIVPEAMHYEEQLNMMLSCEAFGVKICYDYEWLPILQLDAKLKAQVRREMGLAVIYEFMNGVITWNEMKKAMLQDTVEGMDLYVYQLPPEYMQVFENRQGNQTNSNNGTGYQGDTNGENPGVEGATNANT